MPLGSAKAAAKAPETNKTAIRLENCLNRFVSKDSGVWVWLRTLPGCLHDFGDWKVVDVVNLKSYCVGRR